MMSGLKVFILLASFVVFAHGSNIRNTNLPTGPTSDDAYTEYLEIWSKINHIYETENWVRVAVDQIQKYHAEYNMADDPRGPAIDVPSMFPFRCDPSLGKSTATPMSVHALRPGDINVVAALGDSITAGFGVGAESLTEAGNQNRGESWSVGGDRSLELNVTTIPNMLRKFNPGIKGHSRCSSGASDIEYAWDNVAVGGARAVHMPDQATALVNRLRDDPRINMDNDWKMITLFIGGNDLCTYCNNRENRTAELYKKHIQDALDIMHDNIPRAFVNLVPMSDVGFIQNVTFHYPNTSYPGEPGRPIVEDYYHLFCQLFHQFACPCVLTDAERAEQKAVQLEYFDVMKELTDSGRYDTEDDFTVVLQPHLRDSESFKDPFGMTDNRYFAPDCFHPNRRMHQVLAYMLWNVMLTKYGEKPTLVDDPAIWPEYKCPTNDYPFLMTKSNTEPYIEPNTDAGNPSRPSLLWTVCLFAVAGVWSHYY